MIEAVVIVGLAALYLVLVLLSRKLLLAELSKLPTSVDQEVSWILSAFPPLALGVALFYASV